eukprot:SAG11_NODE_4025_length_2100_cov_1.709145_2_plen_586_part_00
MAAAEQVEHVCRDYITEVTARALKMRIHVFATYDRRGCVEVDGVSGQDHIRISNRSSFHFKKGSTTVTARALHVFCHGLSCQRQGDGRDKPIRICRPAGVDVYASLPPTDDVAKMGPVATTADTFEGTMRHLCSMLAAIRQPATSSEQMRMEVARLLCSERCERGMMGLQKWMDSGAEERAWESVLMNSTAEARASYVDRLIFNGDISVLDSVVQQGFALELVNGPDLYASHGGGCSDESISAYPSDGELGAAPDQSLRTLESGELVEYHSIEEDRWQMAKITAVDRATVTIECGNRDHVLPIGDAPRMLRHPLPARPLERAASLNMPGVVATLLQLDATDGAGAAKSIAEEKLAELSRVAADLSYRPGGPGAKEAARRFQSLQAGAGRDCGGENEVVTGSATEEPTVEEQHAACALLEVEEAKARCQKVVRLLVAHQEQWDLLLRQMKRFLQRAEDNSMFDSCPFYTCQGSKVAEMMQKIYSSAGKEARRVKGGRLLQRAQACIDACDSVVDSDDNDSDDSDGADPERPAKKARVAPKVPYELEEHTGDGGGGGGGTTDGARSIPARFTHEPSRGCGGKECTIC